MWILVILGGAFVVGALIKKGKDAYDQGRPISGYVKAIAVVAVVIALAVLFQSLEEKADKQEDEKAKAKSEQQAQEKKQSEAAAEAAKTEDQKVRDLADSMMSNVSTFSFNTYSPAGGPPGAKIVNVISSAYNGSYLQKAGPFLKRVFEQFPDVYYVQMKGRDSGGDVIALEMCRDDIALVSHWDDWEHDPAFCTWVRNYWVDEEWRAGYARNLPQSEQL